MFLTNLLFGRFVNLYMVLNYRIHIKPVIDWWFALVGIIVLIPLFLLMILGLFFIHKGNPFFTQQRVGRFAQPFTIFKFCTIPSTERKIRFLSFLRKSKLDETPQLFNVLLGDMALVGPRPDISGYYDSLQGEEKEILQLKPGITGYASLKFSDEESLLKTQSNPKLYNDTVLFPQKVALNRWYFQHISWCLDMKIIIKTIALPFQKK